VRFMRVFQSISSSRKASTCCLWEVGNVSYLGLEAEAWVHLHLLVPGAGALQKLGSRKSRRLTARRITCICSRGHAIWSERSVIRSVGFVAFEPEVALSTSRPALQPAGNTCVVSELYTGSHWELFTNAVPDRVCHVARRRS
jgi:hypothetical protein